MFVGHFAVGFAARAAGPRCSLGTFFLAAQFLDLLWPTLLTLGWETVAIRPGITRVTPLEFLAYPISHSLLAVIGWAFLLGFVCWIRVGQRKEAVLLGVAVASHWFLDAVTHRPDLPIYPGGEARIGLGLWNSIGGTVALELALFTLGIVLYTRATQPRDQQGRWGLVGLVGFLLVLYAGSVFGDPPPSVTAVAWVSQAQWLFVIWGYWIDRHRSA